MAAKDRKEYIEAGEEIFAEIQDICQQLAAKVGELAGFAQAIVDDYDEQRDALSEREGLLQRWEEDHGYKSDSWESVVSDLENFEDVADAIREMWDAGER